MGHSADRLCERFGVSREEQDKFGHRSHMMAAQATKDGNLSDIIRVKVTGTESEVRSEIWMWTSETTGEVRYPLDTLSELPGSGYSAMPQIGWLKKMEPGPWLLLVLQMLRVWQ